MNFKGIAAGTTVILALAMLPFATSDNLIIGRRSYSDKFLYYTTVVASRGWFGRVTRELRYPMYGLAPANITFISVIDRQWDGKGGYPSLVRGGIGYRNVTIRFQSQYNQGLNFNVTIYGK